jgi:putative restriction endonuclease
LTDGRSMTDRDRDAMMRMAAFEHLRRLTEAHDLLTATELKPGFIFDGQRIPLVNPQRGIFKPQQMRFLLSIKTVFAKPGGKVWYDDQREVHRQIFEGDETIDCAFMGQDPNAADNQWLREAFENRIPIIYFLGISPGRYQVMLPTFISGWDGRALKARLEFGVPDQETLAPPETALERRYALRAVKQRLHQASFREAVITAYNGRCALSGLPEPLLLDAAHIVADKNEQLGQPVVPNGIGAVLQVYRTIKDYRDNRYAQFPFVVGRRIYPVIVTLEDWYFFGQELPVRLEAAVRIDMAAAGLSLDWLEEMPYSIMSLHEFEKVSGVTNAVGIHRFISDKILDAELRHWTYGAYCNEFHSDAVRKLPPLFDDEYDALFAELGA